MVISNQQQQLVLEHFLLISNLKIQIWNTGISFLFDHVVPSMHYVLRVALEYKGAKSWQG